VPTITNFVEANNYLERFHDQARTKYNLNNMRHLMKFLGNPQDELRVVHVAGTSGKTSTAYYVSAFLTAAGQKTGLTVSPHINQINDRLQINGQPLAERLFCEALTEFIELLEKSNVQPSWFELIVAFAYWYFAREKVDYAVIEVGLGGLKDATNIVSRGDKVCVITDIGYDHINVLGKSLPQIAAQKAGIIQPYNQVFSYKQSSEISRVIKNAAEAQKAKLNIIKETNNSTAMPDYQFRNAWLAYKVYWFLQQRDSLLVLSDQEFNKIEQTLIPGRMDIRQKAGKTIVLDGAHNVQKVTALVSSFQKFYPGKRPAILISLKQGKDYEQVVPLLAALASRVIITSFKLAQDVPLHSMDATKLANSFQAAGVDNVIYLDDQAAAVQNLLNGPEQLCLITGSLYLLGQLINSGLV
jgi:dihydrofolate synthase/folylpolyglutamate synthase